jgi:hypothetical protein
MHLSSKPSMSTSSSSINFDSSTSDKSNELEFDQKIRKGRRLWQDIENIEKCNWVATTGDTDDEDEDNKDDQLKEINKENVINNCSNSDGNDSEDGYYSDTDLITGKGEGLIYWLLYQGYSVIWSLSLLLVCIIYMENSFFATSCYNLFI